LGAATKNKSVSLSEAKILTLDEFKNLTYEKVYQRILDKAFAELKSRSIMARIDMLHKLCPPHSDYTPPPGYRYDQERMKRIDDARHGIIHRGELLKPPSTFDNDLDFLQNTCIYCMDLVHARYDLRIDGEYFQAKARRQP
jgi:hypothetical protein